MKTWFALLLATTLLLSTASAWPRKLFTDAEIVSRASLIVVGKIKEDSLKTIMHTDLMSWETRGILVVTETLKGSTEHEIPIIIHYGLDPTVRGKVPGGPFRGAKPEDVIVIIDNGSEGGHVADDIVRNDHIWFLRIQPHWLREEGKDALGIYDPEDVQPLAKKPKFRALIPKA